MHPVDDSFLADGIAFTRRHKISLLAAAIVGGAATFGSSFLFVPKFEADAILISSDEMLGFSQSGALGSLGGLASLVGVSGTGKKESEAIATLRSRGLTRLFIEKNALLPIIFPERWDTAAGKWKPSSRIPTLEDGYRIFDKQIRSVIENRKTGLVTLSIVWSDPELAKRWTDGLVDSANDLLRAQAIERSAKNLEYLQRASEATTVMEVRSTIYKLMESEFKKQMVATGDKNYAFRMVDPPVVPERKVFPRRSIFLLYGVFLTPILWSLLLASRSRSKDSNRQ